MTFSLTKYQFWEHIVLNELQGQLQTKEIRYWRDKQDHELDFITNSQYSSYRYRM